MEREIRVWRSYLLGEGDGTLLGSVTANEATSVDENAGRNAGLGRELLVSKTTPWLWEGLSAAERAWLDWDSTDTEGLVIGVLE